MKAKMLQTFCALVLAGSVATAQTAESHPSTVVKVADAAIVRPLGLASTVIGAVLFTVSLPVSAPLKKTKSTADLLVVKPAQATFTRPLGDMDAMAD